MDIQQSGVTPMETDPASDESIMCLDDDGEGTWSKRIEKQHPSDLQPGNYPHQSSPKKKPISVPKPPSQEIRKGVQRCLEDETIDLNRIVSYKDAAARAAKPPRPSSSTSNQSAMSTTRRRQRSDSCL